MAKHDPVKLDTWERLYRLWRDYRREREGAVPSALLMHHEDWDGVRNNMGSYAAAWAAPDIQHRSWRVFNAVVLVSSIAPRGLPAFLDAAAAAAALQAGARQA